MWPLTLLDTNATHQTRPLGRRDDIPLRPLHATTTTRPRPSERPALDASVFGIPRKSAVRWHMQVEDETGERGGVVPAEFRTPWQRTRELAAARMDLAAKDDVLLALARRSAHVTQQLQRLLDAQSDGLMKGLGRGTVVRSGPASTAERHLSPNGHSYAVSSDDRESVYRDDPLDDASFSPSRSRISASVSPSTYVRSAPRRQKVVPVRQPAPPKPLSLKEARVGIARNLRALAEIKTEEAQLHSVQAQKGSEGLDQIKSLTEQEDGLKIEISKREGKGPDVEEQELEKQELELDGEIRALEERLSELKAHLREVKRTRSERENLRAAEMSSYQNALSELSQRIRREVLSDRSEFRRSKRALQGKEKGVWSLPEDRRTLELVKEDIDSQITEAEGLQKAAVDEGAICEEGAHVWDTVVSRMDTLEKRLSREIRKLHGTRPSSALSNTTSSDDTIRTPDTNGQPNETSGEGMHSVLELMDSTINSLTTDLATAEENGWTLLVCCIGAEVEALKEAQELLNDTLVHSQMLPPAAKSQVRAGPPGPRSEGSGLTASMYTANESSGSKTPVVPADGPAHGEDEEHDVSDPQALFEAHEEGSDQIQGPELLISQE